MLISAGLLFAQDLSLTNDHWRKGSDTNNKFQFSLNAGFNTPIHAYMEKSFQINEHIDLSYGVVFSSENDIAAKTERPNYPIFSTFRFYRGELRYKNKNFNIAIGRHLHDTDPIHQNTIWDRSRITGDGITWSWDFAKNWRFENSIEALPAERPSNDMVFERILNYHAMTWKGKKLSFLFGETDIYTGVNIGVNLLRSNPFLPYSIHMVDTYDTFYPGYSGDNENVVIIFGLQYEFTEELIAKSYIYVDDAQIDFEDRATVSDSYLWFNELYFNANDKFRTSIQFNLANPSFGWHNGPYTDYLVYGHELMPHTYGEIYSLGFNIEYRYKFFEALIQGKMMKKTIFDSDIENLFLWSVQNSLEKVNVYDLNIKTGFYILKNLVLWGQVRISNLEEPVFNFILQTYF